ncbi:MAG TPA: hypothetical protein VIM85_10585 [Pseudomonadales bacterium]
MANASKIKPLSIAMGAAVAVSALSATSVQANENPFVTQDLASGYNLASADTEGKCGEGKCGGDKKAAKEGKCGEGKCGEGKCGGDKKAEKEGKCGADKKADKEGKCGGKK